MEINTDTDNNKLVKNFSEKPFWDINIGTLEYNKNMQFIIERVYVYGDENDEKILNKIYTAKQIKDSVINSVELNESVINYLSVIFNIKKERFNVVQKHRLI